MGIKYILVNFFEEVTIFILCHILKTCKSTYQNFKGILVCDLLTSDKPLKW